MAPGLTSEFISGPPSAFCESSIATIELKRMPVASTPIVLAIASGPDSSMTLRHREDLGDRLDRDLGLDVAGGVDLAVRGDEGDAEDVRVDLGERRDVVGVLAFLQVLVLRVGRVERRLDLGRRLGARGGRRQPRARPRPRRGAATLCERAFEPFITCLPTECLKLYLTENWMRTSSEVKPSRKFSRLPHWISGPRNRFERRVVEEVGQRVLARLERVVRPGRRSCRCPPSSSRRCSSTSSFQLRSRNATMPRTGSALPTIGVTGFEKLFSMPTSTGASFM